MSCRLCSLPPISKIPEIGNSCPFLRRTLNFAHMFAFGMQSKLPYGGSDCFLKGSITRKSERRKQKRTRTMGTCVCVPVSKICQRKNFTRSIFTAKKWPCQKHHLINAMIKRELKDQNFYAYDPVSKNGARRGVARMGWLTAYASLSKVVYVGLGWARSRKEVTSK
jgi:hypothetical protein